MSQPAAAQSIETLAGEGVKETIESIVVALILAFVFRAFVVEAFVIPTGSMAPTLYGAHGTIICEDCGTEFAYGLKDPSTGEKHARQVRSPAAECPNCHHMNRKLQLNDDLGNAESGDRILVLKWPYDLGIDLLAPARWDVTVFKTPADGVTNYIKRMAGLPGEVLMIVDGDVYAAPTDELSATTLEHLDRVRHEKYELRQGLRPGSSLRPVPTSVLEELDETLAIARKTPAAQRELWFSVYDHDYPPRSLDNGQPHWRAGLGEASGWEASTRRVRFMDRGNQADYIELNGTKIRATYAYNIAPGEKPPPVADHRLRFVLRPGSPRGTLLIRLEKLRRVFWATVRMDGLVSITESSGDVPTESTTPMLQRQLPPFSPARSVEVSFENVDYRLALRVGGKEVLVSSGDPDSPACYRPDIRQLRRVRLKSPVQPPRIYAEAGSFELSHLVVERDVYYYEPPPRSHPTTWQRKGWGTTGNPILLREGEYFMLGDNSAASHDSRVWGKVGPHLQDREEAFQLGTVPEDQLIGRAFFVYWPSGHRLSWLPPIRTWLWPIIPDVGRMRWIR